VGGSGECGLSSGFGFKPAVGGQQAVGMISFKPSPRWKQITAIPQLESRFQSLFTGCRKYLNLYLFLYLYLSSPRFYTLDGGGDRKKGNCGKIKETIDLQRGYTGRQQGEGGK